MAIFMVAVVVSVHFEKLTPMEPTDRDLRSYAVARLLQQHVTEPFSWNVARLYRGLRTECT